MLFIVMHKVNADMEAGRPPDMQVVSQMGKLIGEVIEQGIFHNAAGLKRSVERVRLRFQHGRRELIEGPLTGDNELVAGFALLKVQSLDEAIAWTTRMAEVEGDGELEFELGPVVESWDLGFATKPADAPLRVLAMRKSDRASEAGAAPSSEVGAKMARLLTEMKDAGVLLGVEGLAPSARGARLTHKAGKHSWIDGPFAESKELIAGFTILDLPSLAAAKAWAERYAEILGDIEVDVRPVLHSIKG
ncbi:MAG: hypothetical protein JWN48_3469 [Myxococcaceae bacterium]|nr:hypothetical protein [Myxococcaceae bacterium]